MTEDLSENWFDGLIADDKALDRLTAEKEALELLQELIIDNERDFSEAYKKLALELLVKDGCSYGIFILMGHIMGVYSWPKGRPQNVFARVVVEEFFVGKGILPPVIKKKDGYDRSDPGYGLINECAEYLKKRHIERYGISGTHENHRSLVASILQDKEFRSRLQARINAALCS